MTGVIGEILFPTIPVGSLPRPQWVRELVAERKAGRISNSYADSLLDDAVPLAIRLQERAGLDFLSDGEWRRTHYATVFAECVEGFAPNLVPNAGARISERHAAPARTADPGVVSTMKRLRPIATKEAAFLRDHTNSPIIVALPSPYTLAHRMWSAEHSVSVYATREEFMEAIIPIIRQECQELARLGVDAIQIDNPWPPVVIDAGLSLPGALRLAGHRCGRNSLRRAADSLADSFEHGLLAWADTPAARRLPATLVYALRLHAAAGPPKADPPSARLLHQLAEMYAERVRDRFNWFTGMFAPFSILMVGLVIMIVVLALFMPLISLIEGLS